MTVSTTTSSFGHISYERAAQLQHDEGCEGGCDIVAEFWHDLGLRAGCRRCDCGCAITAHTYGLAGCDDPFCPCSRVWERMEVLPPLPSFIKVRPVLDIHHTPSCPRDDCDACLWEEAHP